VRCCVAVVLSPAAAAGQVITLDMGLLVAGTKYRGEFEERLKKLMDEIKQNDDIILVRETHLLTHTRTLIQGGGNRSGITQYIERLRVVPHTRTQAIRGGGVSVGKHMGRIMPWGVPVNGATPYFRCPDQVICTAPAVRVRLTTGVPTHGRLQQPTAASH